MPWVPSIPTVGVVGRAVSGGGTEPPATGTLLGTTATAGGSNSFFGDGDAAGTPYVATGTGTIATLLYAIRASNFTAVRLAIYADNAGTPAARLGVTGPIADEDGGVGDVLLSGALLVPVAVTMGTTYWLFALPTGGTLNMTSTTGSEGLAGKSLGAGTAVLPDPWDQSGGFTDPDFSMPIRGDTA